MLPRLSKADALLLLSAMIWGTSYGVAKSALAYYPVAGLIALRFGLTVLLLLPRWLRLGRHQQLLTLRAGVPTGLVLLLIFLSETAGVSLTSAGNAAFLISLCLLLTPPVEWLWLGKRPAGRFWIGASLSLLGTWLLTRAATGALNRGDMLMLVAALLRACQGCLIRRQTEGKHMDMLGLTTVQAMVVAVGALGLAMTGTGLPALPAAPAFWGAIVYLVMGCTILAFFAMNHALATSSPSHVAVLLGSEPLWGALFATIALGEHLGISGWLGGAIIAGTALWLALVPVRSSAMLAPA
ncbi:DMT family transporter [Leeia oryzae]|uniref:DMT family transporter n=1 Tax=Leeia oryzae TaxID=356662 RepID=UPI000381EA04|nr:DMT family transporter [Leeia oryzae]